MLRIRNKEIKVVVNIQRVDNDNFRLGYFTELDGEMIAELDEHTKNLEVGETLSIERVIKFTGLPEGNFSVDVG